MLLTACQGGTRAADADPDMNRTRTTQCHSGQMMFK